MKDPLSPHHFGEALVARWLSLVDVASLRVRAPSRPSEDLRLDMLLASVAPVEIVPNAKLEASAGGPRFDGMHDIDCALVLRDEVIPIELKLGETGLSPTTFARRFLKPGVRLTHGDSAVAGSMVALLDDNGRADPSRLCLPLRACSRPVRRQWLLMLRDETWRQWARTPALATKLNTQQLAGVITLEDVAEQVGVMRAKEIAIAMARASIDPWFAPTREASRSSHTALTLVVVRCRDLERSRAFYASLGLSLRPEKHGEGPTHFSAMLQGGVVLELYPSRPDRPFAPMRLGLRVERLDAIASALGVEVVDDSGEGARRCVVEDPDGHVIELSSTA